MTEKRKYLKVIFGGMPEEHVNSAIKKIKDNDSSESLHHQGIP